MPNAGITAKSTGGTEVFKFVSAATTNADNVKSSAGNVYGVFASNVNAAVRYVKLYDLAGDPSVGTSVPALTLAIPGSTAGGILNFQIPVGIYFPTGIAVAMTTEATDAGSTAVSANEHVVHILYK